MSSFEYVATAANYSTYITVRLTTQLTKQKEVHIANIDISLWRKWCNVKYQKHIIIKNNIQECKPDFIKTTVLFIIQNTFSCRSSFYPEKSLHWSVIL